MAATAAAVAPAVGETEIAPYEARVTTPRAQVRSGPGEKFYPTDTLPQGDTVEVYRQQDDGWLAIRPPAGSFSWISAKQLKLREGGLAEIEQPNVPSRIGSRLSDLRIAAQVRLKKGEVVEVVGEQKIDGQLWYQIAPPAGEFRWIHASCVQRLEPLSSSADEPEATPVVTASATEASNGESTKTEGDATAPETPEPDTNSNGAAGDLWRSPSGGAASSPAEISAPPLAAVTPDSEPAEVPTAVAPSPPEPATAAGALSDRPAGPAAGAASEAGTDDLSRQLTEIEMRLSRMASAPPQLWNTERLERDTEQLLARAESPAARDSIKVTLAKIDRFASLGRQYQQGAGVVMAGSPNPALLPTAGLRNGAGSGDPRATAPLVAPGMPTGDGRYDAVGILRPVVSKRPGAPQFALVDDQGQVLTFVTPTPDVNLQPFLGRRIGIAGTRGFIPEFNRAHVTAARITPLSERMVR
jgi:hypothetical protein